MKSWKKLLLAAVPVSLAMTFQAYAGQWHQDMNGWWYETDDGGYLANGWNWIDGNRDGIAECYYFDTSGYLVLDQGYADGYTVDANGAWVENGEVQRKNVEVPETVSSGTDFAEALESSDPMTVYLAAQEKADKLNSMDMSIDYSILAVSETTAMNMAAEMNIRMKGIVEGPLQYTVDGSTGIQGVKIPISMFYTDGYYYTDTLGLKTKEATSVEDAIASARSNANTAKINKEMIENLQMRTEGENTILSYTVNANYMNDYLKKMMGEEYGDIYGDSSYTIRSSSGESVINKEGYSEKENVYMDMDMTAVNPNTGVAETINFKITMHAVIHNPGQEVEVVIPSTEGYMETSSLIEP